MWLLGPFFASPKPPNSVGENGGGGGGVIFEKMGKPAAGPTSQAMVPIQCFGS